MPSLRHLGPLARETYRIAVSEPLTPARQARRICLLWCRALGSVNKILLVMTVVFAVLVALRATGADRLRGLSPIDWAIACLGVLLVVAVLCRSRPVRILPFKNLTDGAGNQQAAAVAAGFAELLDDEIRRIVDLVRQEPFRTPADVLNPAGRRGDMVRRSSARVPFKTGVAATGLPGDIKPTEVGTITLGPLKLQVGTVLACLERVFGTTLQGSLVEADGVLRVVASQSGLRGGRTWSAEIRVDGDTTRSPDGRLARELAHRVELDRPGASESGADVESFQRLVDGLENYQRFQQEGALRDLDEAEDHFRAALAHSPEYAAAYHNLGLIYREQQRVRTEIRLTVSEAMGDGPIRMWQKAVDLDPTLAPARVQLARAFLDKARPPGVGDDKRADLLQQAVQSARSALEQPSGTHSVDSTLARYWLGYALRKQGGQQQPHGKHRSDDMTWEALASFRRAEQDLIDERARRLVRDGNTTAVRPLTERIAQVIGQQAKCWAQLADEAVGPDRKRHVSNAKSRIGTAIGWAPGMPELHALRGSILLRYDPGDGAWHAFMEALQRDPQNHHITPRDLGVFTAMTSRRSEDRALAADLFMLAAHRRPDDAMAWLLLALLAPDDRNARSLAGKGLALDPGSDEIRKMVDTQWPTNGTAGPPKHFTRIWAQAWDAARQAQQSGNAGHLRAALGDITDLCVQHGRTQPEVTYVSREIGLLHTSLALMTDPSGDQRAQFRLAIRHLTQAVALKPPPGVEVPSMWYVELADAHAALADSLSGKERSGKTAAKHKAAAENYEEAIRNYNEAINKSPKTVRPRYHTGQKGRERFTELTADPPDLSPRARATAGRAAVYASQGRVNDAIQDCRDALKLAPLYAYPRFTLAVLYREQRAQYDLARQTLLRLIELLPAGEERDRGRLELARTYRMHAEASPAGDRERLLDLALEGLVKATREASLSTDLEAEIYEELATVLNLLGRSREAIAALRSIGDAPDRAHSVQHHERIARLMARGEQPLEVEQELITAQRACRDRLKQCRGTDEEQVLGAVLVSLKAQLAMFYAEQGIKLKKAHRMARNALRTAPSSMDPARLAVCEDARGWVAYREGRVRQAVRLLEDAVEHSAGDAQEWAHLALALEARSTSLLGHGEKHLDRARDIWQQILEQCPRSPAAEQARHHLNLLPDHLHRPRPLASRGLGGG